MSEILYLLVEDDRDYDYCEKIIEPLLYETYNQVIIYKYVRKKKTKVIKFINVIKKINADYYILTDMDESATIKEAIKKILKRVNNSVKPENVIVVIKEIECWYIAGIPQSFVDRYEISLNISNTEKYCKEEFYPIIPNHLSHIIFYSTILELYDFDTSLKRNSSLNHFITKISTN